MSSLVTNRNSTFSGSGLYKTYDPSIIQAQQVQRLRVNRVAIVQALRVDHVLPKLCETGVLTQPEAHLILAGKTQQEKTRLLIDLLPAKGKLVDWYGNFKEALKHPDTRSADVRRKYQILLEFLDNTLIPIPPKKTVRSIQVSPLDQRSSNGSYPRYNPLPNISNNASPDNAQNISPVAWRREPEYVKRTEARDDTHSRQIIEEEPASLSRSPNRHRDVASVVSNQHALIKGFFHREVTIPENFKALIQEPEEHFRTLDESDNPEDSKLLAQEREVLVKAQNVEVVYALDRRKKLPNGMELCFSHAVAEMLQDPTVYHLYFKYFQELNNRYNLNVLLELTASFTSFVSKLEDASDPEVRKQVITVGFGLFDFVCQAGMFVKAEGIILELMRFLSTCSSLDNWMAVWQALVKLQTVSNNNGYFKDADQWYVLACEMGDKIKMMSFGQDLLDESQLFIELSITHREQGSLGPAYEWAQSAVKEVDNDNYSGIVEVLCNAALAYSMQWNVKQAEKLAIEACRTAKEHFGEYHPLYVKALIHVVSYCNEFRQDEFSVHMARRAVEISEKIFGGAACLLTAQAYEVLAKSLIVNQQFSTDEYTQSALKAYRMAMDLLPSLHPKFASFKITNAQVLLWKASMVEEQEKESVLLHAEEEAKAALQIYKLYWGEYSLKLAQAYCVLGQIYAKMNNKKEVAEEMLIGAYNIYLMSVNPRSNYQCLIKATMGTFYKSVGKPLQAIDFLSDCVKDVSNCGVFLKWVHVAYESLISMFRATNQMSDAESYQLAHVDWIKKNPKLSESLSWERLHQPATPFEDFRQEFFVLATKLQKAKRGLRHFMEQS